MTKKAEDDIVERLREPVELDVPIETCRLMDKAADEIERLREELDFVIHEGEMVEGQIINAEITRLRAREAELVEALEPLADYAVDRIADAPEWADNDTVSIVVEIGDLRRARALTAQQEGDGDD